MKQLFHILFMSLLLLFGSCQKNTFQGSGKYKKNRNQKKNDNYLESEAGKVIDKSDKRNKKANKKKIKEHRQTQDDEIEESKKSKKGNKRKKKNTGSFQFY